MQTDRKTNRQARQTKAYRQTYKQTMNRQTDKQTKKSVFVVQSYETVLYKKTKLSRKVLYKNLQKDIFICKINKISIKRPKTIVKKYSLIPAKE